MILKIELENFFYKIVITTLQITDLPEKDEENVTDHLTAEVWVYFF